jgi:hypothetical protein
MMMQQNLAIHELMATQDHDRTLRATEEYELHRALRELDELNRARRKEARQANRREGAGRRLGLILRRA